MEQGIMHSEVIGIYIFMAIITIVMIGAIYSIFNMKRILSGIAFNTTSKSNESAKISQFVGPQGPKGDMGLRGDLTSATIGFTIDANGLPVDTTLSKVLLDRIDFVFSKSEGFDPTHVPAGTVAINLIKRQNEFVYDSVIVNNTDIIVILRLVSIIPLTSDSVGLSVYWDLMAKGLKIQQSESIDLIMGLNSPGGLDISTVNASINLAIQVFSE